MLRFRGIRWLAIKYNNNVIYQMHGMQLSISLFTREDNLPDENQTSDRFVRQLSF